MTRRKGKCFSVQLTAPFNFDALPNQFSSSVIDFLLDINPWNKMAVLTTFKKKITESKLFSLRSMFFFISKTFLYAYTYVIRNLEFETFTVFSSSGGYTEKNLRIHISAPGWGLRFSSQVLDKELLKCFFLYIRLIILHIWWLRINCLLYRYKVEASKYFSNNDVF